MNAASNRLSGSYSVRILLAGFLAGLWTPLYAQGEALSPCLSCHEAPALSSRIAEWNGQERAERLDQFLSQHFAPEPAQREAIICALMESVEGASADGDACESP